MAESLDALLVSREEVLRELAQVGDMRPARWRCVVTCTTSVARCWRSWSMPTAEGIAACERSNN